jgi:hypothetical protein
LVDLGIHPELVHNWSNIRGTGVFQVNPGCLAVATAPGGLTVDGDMRCVAGPESFPDPSADTRFEIRDVDATEDPPIGGQTETAPLGEPWRCPVHSVAAKRMVY